MRGPYAAEQVFTTGIALSETESGTGVDSALLTTALSDTDTGAGVDVESISRTTVALADLGIGQDAEVARTADLASSDTGKGKEKEAGSGSYNLVVLQDAPRAYWRFDDGKVSGQTMNMAPPFEEWTLGGTAYIDDKTGELVLPASGDSATVDILWDGGDRLTISMDGWSPEQGPHSDPGYSAVHWGTNYFNADGTGFTNAGGWTGNGHAPANSLTVSDWVRPSWSPSSGYAGMYRLQVRVHASSNYTANGQRYRRPMVTSATGSIPPSTPFFSYYTLTGNAIDATGNGNDGEYVGKVEQRRGAVYGSTDPGIRIEGTDAAFPRVRWPDPAWMPFGTTYSFEAWIKTTTTRSKALWSYGGGNQFLTFMADTSTVIYNGSATATINHKRVADNTFHHVVFTHDGTTVRMYIDTVLQGSGTLATISNAGAGHHLVIGQEQDGNDAGYDTTQGWDGSIDEAAVYDYALTPAQIQIHYEEAIQVVADVDAGTGGDNTTTSTADYNPSWVDTYRGTVLRQNPLGYWRLNTNTGTAVDESVNAQNGTINGTLYSIPGALRKSNTTAVENTAQAFGNYINIPHSVTLSPNYITASAWVKRPVTTFSPGNDYIVMNKENSYEIGLFKGSGSFGLFRVAIFTTTSGTWYWMDGGATVPYDNEWHHIAFTFDGTTVRFYVNGKLAGSSVMNAGHEGPLNTTTSPVRWLARGNTVDRWVGAIDEAAIFGYVLSDEEIAAQYNAKDGSAYYEDSVLSDSPSAYWRLGEESGLDVFDETTAIANGTYVGSPILGVDGALIDSGDSAVRFNGLTDGVTVTNSTAFATTTAVTVEAWVRRRGAAKDGSAYTAIVRRALAGQGAYEIAVRESDGQVWWAINAGTYWTANYTGYLLDSEWHHLVLTYDSVTGGRFYVDGQPVREIAGAGDMGIQTGDAPLGIGYGADITAAEKWRFNGDIDEVSIYKRRLADSEVKKHFRTGTSRYALDVLDSAPVAYWRLNELAGSISAVDETGNGYNASHASDGVTFGRKELISENAGSSANFAGAHTGLDVPAGPAIPNGFTVEAWVQLDAEDTGDRQSIISYGENEVKGFVWAAKQGGGANQPGRLWVNHGGVWPGLNYGTILRAGKTYHLAATYNISTKSIRLYVNGVLDAAVDNIHANAYSPPAGNLTIGARDSRNMHRLAGGIDEPAIYDRVLGDEEIRSHYLMGAPGYEEAIINDNPVGYWRLGETFGTTAQDASGNGHNAVWSGSPILGEPGVLVDDADRSVRFASGHSGTLTAPSAATIPSGNEVSVELWTQFDDTARWRNTTLITTTSAGGYRQVNIHLPWSNNNVYWDAGGTTTGTQAYDRINKATTPAELEGTHHWVFTKNAVTGVMRIYLDGQLWHEGTGMIRPVAVSDSTRTLIGTPAFGIHDELAVYDRELTADDVARHYRLGSEELFTDRATARESSSSLAVLTNADTGAGADSSTSTGDAIDVDSGTGVDTEAAPSAAIADIDTGMATEDNNLFYGGATTDSAVGIESQQLAVLLSQPDTAAGVDTEHKVQMYFSFDSGTSIEDEIKQKLASIIVLSPPHTQQRYEHFVLDGKPVAYWRLGETAGATMATDATGNGYDGTYRGAPLLGAPGALASDSDAAVEFDGVDDYIALPMYYNTVGAIPQLTVTCWFRTDVTSAIWNDQWSFLDFDRSDYFNFYLRADTGVMGFSTTDSLNRIHDQYGTTSLNDGLWHFAAVVYDGTDKIIYVDGREEARASNPYGGNALGNGITRYGFIADGSEAATFDGDRNLLYYAGAIDEVSLHHLPLSALEISRLYSVGSASRYGFGAVEPETKPIVTTDTVDAYQFDWATTPA